MKWFLMIMMANDIRGWMGPKFSWHSSYGWGKIPQKPQPGKLTGSSAHSPTFPSLHLRHSSFSNPSAALPTSQPILQPFRHFIYVTANSPTLPPLYLRHSSFSNPSAALPTSQLILQPFRRFTYVIAHSPILPLLHPCHSSFSNPSAALPTSQLILQPFRCFTYVTVHSPTFLSLLLRHKLFT